MSALLFIPAGTFHYWQGWIYILTFTLSSVAYVVYLVKHDPALLKRRTEAGISYEKETTQKIVISFIYITFFTLFIFAPLDFRFGWSNVPWYNSIFGDVLVAISFYIFYLVSKVNTYAAANVRVEKEQKVISTGLYGIVRHPMYLGALILVLGTPLALGSWWGLVSVLVFIVLLAIRTFIEEKTLRTGLRGYNDYATRVRYRLIPMVW